MSYLGTKPSNQTPTYKQVYEYTATAGQTTFTASYTVGFVSVFRNGVQLNSADYTATNGTSVVLANAASSGDAIRIESVFTANVQGAIPNVANAVVDSNINSMTASKLSGQVPASNAPSGSVIQVVSAVYSAQVSATTQTWVDTGLTATITPKFATSKILVMVHANGVYKDTNNTWVWLRVLANGALDMNMGTFHTYNTAVTPNSIGTVAVCYLSGTVGTTSPFVYKLQMASGNNAANAYINVSAADSSSIVLMEIAA